MLWLLEAKEFASEGQGILVVRGKRLTPVDLLPVDQPRFRRLSLPPVAVLLANGDRVEDSASKLALYRALAKGDPTERTLRLTQ